MVGMFHSLDTYMGPMAPFVSRLLAELAQCGCSVQAPHIDHLCYRSATLPEYRRLSGVLAEVAELLVEGMIGGRPIATYRLHHPVQLGEVMVPCIELAAPKPGRVHQAGLEHIELVVASLSALVARYPKLPFKTDNMHHSRNPDIGLLLPSGQIKFHLRPLAEVIAEEIAIGAVVAVPADYFERD